MSKNRIGRREVIRRSLTVLGAAVVVPSALAACGGSEGEGGLDCSDTSGLQPAQVQMRQSQHYVEASPHSDKNCANCNFYTAGAANACGTCSVIQGSINPQGYCNLWAASAS
jgi:hypothetical protein